MKKLVPMILLAAAGCGGLSRQDLDDLQRRLESKMAQTAAEMDRKVTKVVQMEPKVSSGLERIDGHAKLLESANATMVLILSAQKNALKEQLASVEAQLEALQK